MEQFISLKETDPSKIYTLLQKISSGNNKNDLYKIKHKKTGQILVAKIIKNNLNLYKNQIKSLIKFENPYLVQYFNSYIKQDKIWIITEYCDCGNVQDIMKITNKNYKEIEIASIISMVLKGLQYLHLQKKYHGGIKLNNILINNEGVIKLSDYNISEQLLFNKDENIKNTPPELLGKNKLENYSVKSDIWYIGFICIELAEGTPDIKNGKIIQEKNNQNGMKYSNLWSLEFIDFIQKCLNENPLNRPSAASLLNHPFILNNNKGKIIIKKKISSIKALIDVYREKIDEQEEKNNLNDLGKDNLEVTSFNDNLNKDLIDEINYKKNSASLNVYKSKYKHKSLLINREYKMNQYKKIKKFKIGSKSIQIQNSSKRKNSNFILSNKASSNKKSTKTSIKKVINSNEIFAINEDLLRKKRHSLVNKYLKNSLKLQKQNNNSIVQFIKLNNTLDNIRPRNNLMKLLNVFERDKKDKSKSLNKSQKIKNIENIFNIFNRKENITNSIRLTNISKNTNNNNKIYDKSISSIDSLRFSNADKKNKNFNSIDNNNLIKLKTRNKKSNGGNSSLSDLNDNNKNVRKTNQKKNKILRNLLLREKQNDIGYEKNIINIENNNGYKIINANNDIKVYNNEYIFKLNNSANISNKYNKKKEKNDYKFQDSSIKIKKFNRISKAPIVYYLNQNEIKKIQKIPTSSNNKKNLIKKKKLKLIDNIKNVSNNINENSNIYNDSIQENEKSGNIYNINNTDININLNNINNSNYYINTNNSKYYNNKSYSFNINNTNNNILLLSEEELKHLCLNDKINERELPQLITELAGLENKMNQEIQKIRELYEPIISQHKDGIKFLKQNPFLKNIKEFKNFEIFKNKMKYNTNDDFENRNISSSVHNMNKIKISFYRANDIEEINISANKYLFDKTGYYNNMMKI